MAQFEIIVGSVLGATEYVADALEATLKEKGHEAKIHLTPDLNDIDPTVTWLICTSTHGAGDLPDNIQPFAQQLHQQNLNNTQYLVIGLGDSSYDTFCHGAEKMQQKMQQANAELLVEPLHIDVLVHPIPEDHAVEWLNDWLDKS